MPELKHFASHKSVGPLGQYEVPVTSSESEHELWEKFRNGDKTAFTIIYNRNIEHLYNFCFQFSRDEEISKDIIHDVFINLRMSSSRTKIKSVKSYLFRCVYTEWLKRKKKLKIPEIDTAELISLSIEDKIIEDQEMKNRLEDLKKRINLLTSKQKKSIMLFYYEGMSYEQLAEVLSLKNAKSARKLVYRALDKMRSSDSESHLFLLFFI